MLVIEVFLVAFVIKCSPALNERKNLLKCFLKHYQFKSWQQKNFDWLKENLHFRQKNETISLQTLEYIKCTRGTFCKTNCFLLWHPCPTKMYRNSSTNCVCEIGIHLMIKLPPSNRLIPRGFCPFWRIEMMPSIYRLLCNTWWYAAHSLFSAPE